MRTPHSRTCKLVGALFALASVQGCSPGGPDDASGQPDVGGKADDPSSTLDDQNFLVSDGVGSEADAIAYYESLGPEFVPGEYTLTDWYEQFIGELPINQGLYRNATELGFWREMTCSDYVGRGIGGCWVRNWPEPDGPTSGDLDLGTVAMNVGADGFTRFFVFAPGGVLSPLAILDDEGAKYVPQVCIACHNGSYTEDRDLEAIFREFEPSILTPVSPLEAPQQWYDLNQSVRSANASLRTASEGAGLRVDHARGRQEQYIKKMYVSASPPVALDVRDPAHIPASWSATLNVPPTVVQARKKLWTNVVAPYCMTCHRTNDMDWSDYATFEFLALDLGGRSYLEHVTADFDDHEPGVPFMPQAKLLFEELQGDSRVDDAIEDWVDALGGPVCEAGMECTPTEICMRGKISSCNPNDLVCQPTVPVANGTPCGPDATCHDGECVGTIVITIPQVPSRVYVRTERPDDPEAHVHLSVGGGKLFVRQLDLGQMCSDPASEHALSCNVATLTCNDPLTGDSWTVIAGGTLERKNPTRPEVAGIYRIESPLVIDSCSR